MKVSSAMDIRIVDFTAMQMNQGTIVSKEEETPPLDLRIASEDAAVIVEN